MVYRNRFQRYQERPQLPGTARIKFERDVIDGFGDRVHGADQGVFTW